MANYLTVEEIKSLPEDAELSMKVSDSGGSIVGWYKPRARPLSFSPHSGGILGVGNRPGAGIEGEWILYNVYVNDGTYKVSIISLPFFCGNCNERTRIKKNYLDYLCPTCRKEINDRT